MENWQSAWAFFVWYAGAGLSVAVLVHFTGYFLAPERIVPFLH